jgi:hypothetical protein
LIYCSEYHCSHWTAISGDQWLGEAVILGVDGYSDFKSTTTKCSSWPSTCWPWTATICGIFRYLCRRLILPAFLRGACRGKETRNSGNDGRHSGLEAAKKLVIVSSNPLLREGIPNQGIVIDLPGSDEIAKMIQISNGLFLSYTVNEAQQ